MAETMGAWRDEIKRIKNILGDATYMTETKATAMGILWEKLCPRRILEIGTWQGIGAVYMGAMAKFYNGHVWTIDLPWTGAPNEHFDTLAEEWLARCNVTNVTVIRRKDGAQGFLREHFVARETPFDFVYIDAGHTWNDTAAQYAMARAATKHGGWLCFDDLWNDQYPEVDLVWSQIVMPDHEVTFENDKLGFALVKRRDRAR